MCDKQVVAFQRYGKLSREVKYHYTVPTEASMWKSILKMDIRPCVSFDLKRFHRAIERTWSVLQPALKQPTLTFIPDFVLTTSATFPYTVMGFRSKSEVFSDSRWLDAVGSAEHLCTVWRVSGKSEIKSTVDIKDGKIRTFIIPPLHLLWWQKVFFAAQDNELKSARWGSIRYGLCFAYGGFDKLMRKHEGRTILFGDVSGWDRLLPILRDVYAIRRRGLSIPNDLEDKYGWVVENTVNAKLLLPNGDIIQKGWGNNSGGGCTTADNCITHDIVVRYIEDRIDYEADTWGDDFIGSSTSKNAKNIIQQAYTEFGFTMKYLTEISSPEGAEFLGATCVLFDGYYVPAYSSDRIYAAMVLTGESHTLMDEVSKYYAFLFLSWNDVELFDEIVCVLVECLKDDTLHGEMVGFLRKQGIPTRLQVIYNFWIGSESSLYIPEEEAFKNVMTEFNVIQSAIFRKTQTEV